MVSGKDGEKEQDEEEGEDNCIEEIEEEDGGGGEAALDERARTSDMEEAEKSGRAETLTGGVVGNRSDEKEKHDDDCKGGGGSDHSCALLIPIEVLPGDSSFQSGTAREGLLVDGEGALGRRRVHPFLWHTLEERDNDNDGLKFLNGAEGGTLEGRRRRRRGTRRAEQAGAAGEERGWGLGNEERLVKQQQRQLVVQHQQEQLPFSVVWDDFLLTAVRRSARRVSAACLHSFVQELRVADALHVLRCVLIMADGDTMAHFQQELFACLRQLTADPRHRPLLSKGGGGGGGGGALALPFLLSEKGRLTDLLQTSVAIAVQSQATRSAAGGGGEGGRSGQRPPGGGGSGGGGDATLPCLLARPLRGVGVPLTNFVEVICDITLLQRRREESSTGRAGSEGGAGALPLPFLLTTKCIDLRLFECLRFECEVPWPYAEVASPESISRYGLVTALLLQLTFTVETLQLSKMQGHEQKREGPKSRSAWHRHHVHLGTLLHFARVVYVFITTQVVEVSWAPFLSRGGLLSSRAACCLESVRDLTALHESCVEAMLYRCFLQPLHRGVLGHIRSMLQTSLSYAHVYQGHLQRHHEQQLVEQQQQDREASDSAFQLDSLSESFRREASLLTPLLESLVESRDAPHVADLLAQLNFTEWLR